MTTTLPIGFKYTAAFLAGRPQHTRFDNFSRKHPQMDRRKRAKIFAPFDALDGYSDSIDSKNVEYVERVELEEADRIELNRRLQILRALSVISISLDDHVVVAGNKYISMREKGLMR